MRISNMQNLAGNFRDSKNIIQIITRPYGIFFFFFCFVNYEDNNAELWKVPKVPFPSFCVWVSTI